MTLDYAADEITESFDDAFSVPATWAESDADDATTQQIDVVLRRFVNRGNAQSRESRYDVQLTLAARAPVLCQGNVVTLNAGAYVGRYLLGRAYFDDFGWQIAYARKLSDRI